MAVLRRNVRVSSKTVKAIAYTALVSPYVEYCSAVWNPYTKRLTQRVWMVQRCTARWVCSKHRQGHNCTGPTEMINHLSWPSLELRRKVAWLTLLYKMSNNLVHQVPPCPCTLWSQEPPHASMPLTRILTCQYQTNSFFPRTVVDWNQLPYQSDWASSLEAFIASVMKHLDYSCSTTSIAPLIRLSWLRLDCYKIPRPPFRWSHNCIVQ